MLRRLIMLAGILGLLQVAQAAPPITKDIQLPPTISLSGPWLVNFCWEVEGCGQEHITIRQKKQFLAIASLEIGPGTSSTVEGGVGATSGTYAILYYDAGCHPDFISTATTETSMGGTMSCTDGSGDSGTWTAVPASDTDAVPPERGAPTVFGVSMK